MVSSLEPLKSLQNKLFNGSRLDIGSVCGAEIRRKQIRENARFTRFCAFLRVSSWRDRRSTGTSGVARRTVGKLAK